jgi:hypothetical protein
MPSQLFEQANRMNAYHFARPRRGFGDDITAIEVKTCKATASRSAKRRLA